MVLKMTLSFTRSMTRAQAVATLAPREGDDGTMGMSPETKELNQREDHGESTASSASSSSSFSSFMDDVALEDEQQNTQQLVQQRPHARATKRESTPAVDQGLIEISLVQEDGPSQSDLDAIDDLIDCAKEGDLPTFMRLCELLQRRHITPDCAGYMGWTPAHWAARHGHVHILEYLMQQEVNLDVLDKKGDSLLHKAAANGQFRICQWLLQCGFNVQARNNNGQTPLAVAQELLAMTKSNEARLCEAILANENAHTF